MCRVCLTLFGRCYAHCRCCFPNITRDSSDLVPPGPTGPTPGSPGCSAYMPSGVCVRGCVRTPGIIEVSRDAIQWGFFPWNFLRSFGQPTFYPFFPCHLRLGGACSRRAHVFSLNVDDRLVRSLVFTRIFRDPYQPFILIPAPLYRLAHVAAGTWLQPEYRRPPGQILGYSPRLEEGASWRLQPEYRRHRAWFFAPS